MEDHFDWYGVYSTGHRRAKEVRKKVVEETQF